MFRFKTLRLENYRCFQDLSLTLEPDLTLLFAQNGEGKSTILRALAQGLAVFQPGGHPHLKLRSTEDPRMVNPPGRDVLEPVGPCALTWTADVGLKPAVTWSMGIHPSSGRTNTHVSDIFTAMEETRTPGVRWPLFAYYGTERMGREHPVKRREVARDRWEGYAYALQPGTDDSALMKWLLEEIVSDAERRRVGEEERFLVSAVMDALVRATPTVTKAWYDARRRSPTLRLKDETIVPWKQLSDGYHVFLALVADIARRAVMLNASVDGGEAPLKVEGVVLIDEIDLHLHPHWQRTVLKGLRAAFPRLQCVVTTHSPQVLSSVENRQVRRLVGGKVHAQGLTVEGRDSNAILRDWMHTEDRDDSGKKALAELYDAIDRGDRALGSAILSELKAKWGNIDPELIRASAYLDEED